jgi:hypothetical protein
MPTRFVAGIYNYCNRWCERCPKTAQCLVFASGEHYRALAEGRESRDPCDDLEPPTPEGEAFVRELVEAQGEITERDLEEAGREEARIQRLIDEDPLGPLSRQVARALHEWWRQSIAPPIQDPLLAEAREIIGHYGIMLHPKIHRALHGFYLARVQSDDDWLDDANGTAKVMLLGIGELLPAVEAVALVAPRDRNLRLALANLPVLRALLLERLPRAMSYVRAGWDDDGAVK